MNQSLADKKKQIRIDMESEANRYLVGALLAIVLAMFVVFILNEFEIFELNKILVRACTIVSFATYAVLSMIIRSKKFASSPSIKFVIMGTTIAMVFFIAVMLNINATLILVVPMLLATQYSSYSITLMAICGSVLSSFAAPVCAYLLKTWNYKFLSGYLETVCGISITGTGTAAYTTWQSVGRILMFLGFPQVLAIMAIGVIILAITKSKIANYKNQLRVLDLSEHLSAELDRVNQIKNHTIISFSDLIESRDSNTGDHVRRTSSVVNIMLSAMLADSEFKIDQNFAETVVKYAPMHDIGKIAIDDSILRKPGRLTADEYEIIKTHSVKSAEIIRRILEGVEDENNIQIAANLALYHHERPDGTGYPEGLKGSEIPLEARIMAIADVYDALVSERCYKKAMSFEEAFNVIEEGMGTQFDASLNPYFICSREQIEKFYLE